ncbi:GNAT family N-acetyltransferase [Pandoraea anhela]|uniref:GNAT family N-acetyltransferase n=1 Tax=Pandoraea anhela TaxID=2508295 RepID=UPI0012426353|nr:GNAT family N-acetyltransferase [Pandoraea anhela]
MVLRLWHVPPSQQRGGIGALLLAHAEAQMRSLGHRVSRLETDTFHPQSWAFYEGRKGDCEVAVSPDEARDRGFTTVLLTTALRGRCRASTWQCASTRGLSPQAPRSRSRKAHETFVAFRL